MKLPRFFGRKDSDMVEPRVVASTHAKKVNESEAESGLYPARIATRQSKQYIRLAWRVIIGSLLIIILLSVLGYLDPLKNIFFGYSRGTGGLVVSTEYAQAHVYIDGTLSGQTPFTGENISAGKHKIMLRAIENPNGYFADKNFDIEVSEGNTVVLKAALAPSEELTSYILISPHYKQWEEETLVITGVPNVAKVSIDGAPLGQVPVETSSILEGIHKVTVTAPGYREISVDINVLPERSIVVDFQLYKYQLTLDENEN